MSNFIKFIVFVGMLLYVVSPADLVPGPIDDAIVILSGMAMQRSLP